MKPYFVENRKYMLLMFCIKQVVQLCCNHTDNVSDYELLRRGKQNIKDYVMADVAAVSEGQ